MFQIKLILVLVLKKIKTSKDLCGPFFLYLVNNQTIFD